MWHGRIAPQPVEIVGEKIPLDISGEPRYGVVVAQFQAAKRSDYWA
jgi:hypothetical protein